MHIILVAPWQWSNMEQTTPPSPLRIRICVAALAAEHRAATMYVDGRAAVWGRADTSLFQMGEGAVLIIFHVGITTTGSSLC